MGYKNPEKQREYQRRWVAQRREQWFEGKSCEHCGSTDDLRLHHRDPTTKTSHRIWNWSEERRTAELRKCEVLCDACHVEHHRKRENRPVGEATNNAVLTVPEVLEARDLRAEGWLYKDLAVRFNVNPSTIRRAVKGQTWIEAAPSVDLG